MHVRRIALRLLVLFPEFPTKPVATDIGVQRPIVCPLLSHIFLPRGLFSIRLGWVEQCLKERIVNFSYQTLVVWNRQSISSEILFVHLTLTRPVVARPVKVTVRVLTHHS